MPAELESKELLSICLSKISGLKRVTMVDAGFIWTEPHSMRLKVKLTIQKDVLTGVRLQQAFVVDVVIQNRQCEDCARSFTEHTWRAIVQLRQRVPHKKTFFFLEQLILKYNAHAGTVGIEQQPDGIDFQFADRSAAAKFVDFLAGVVPIKFRTAKKLVSHDIHTATYNYKYTFATEIVPLCKEDLVVLPPQVAAALGATSPLMLVFRVTGNVHLVSPTTLHSTDLTAERFWADEFRPLVSADRLQEFVVLDVVPVTITAEEVAASNKAAARRGKRVKAGRRRRRNMPTIDEDDDSEEEAAVLAKAFGGRSARRRHVGGADVDLDDDAGDDESDAASTMATSKMAKSVRVKGAAGAVASLASSSKFSKNMGMSMAKSIVSAGLKSAVSGRSVGTTVAGGPRGRYLLCDIEVARVADFGVNDTRFVVRSHLGHVLKPGDRAMGYDLRHAVTNDEWCSMEALNVVSQGKQHARAPKTHKELQLPDIVLVRKHYPRMLKKSKTSRSWELRKLDMVRTEHIRAGDLAKEQADYESFLQDLEIDPSMRAKINLYKSQAAAPAAKPSKVLTGVAARAGDAADSDSDVEDDAPGVQLAELMETMTLGADGGAGGAAAAASAAEPMEDF